MSLFGSSWVNTSGKAKELELRNEAVGRIEEQIGRSNKGSPYTEGC